MDNYVYKVVKINRLEYNDLVVYSELISKNLWKIKSISESIKNDKNSIKENGYIDPTTSLFLDHTTGVARIQYPSEYVGFYTYDIEENYPNFMSSLQKQTFEKKRSNKKMNDIMCIPPTIEIYSDYNKINMHSLKYNPKLKKEINIKIATKSVFNPTLVEIIFGEDITTTTSKKNHTIKIKYERTLEKINTIIYLHRLYYLDNYEKMLNYIRVVDTLSECSSTHATYNENVSQMGIHNQAILAHILYILRNQIIMWDKVKFCKHIKLSRVHQNE